MDRPEQDLQLPTLPAEQPHQALDPVGLTGDAVVFGPSPLEIALGLQRAIDKLIALIAADIR